MRTCIVQHPYDDSRRYFVDDKEVTKEQYEKLCKPRGIAFGEVVEGDRPACWPMVSEAMGVMPAEREAATADALLHGCNVEFRPGGEAVVPDKATWKRLARAYGYHAKNGGYSDP